MGGEQWCAVVPDEATDAHRTRIEQVKSGKSPESSTDTSSPDASEDPTPVSTACTLTTDECSAMESVAELVDESTCTAGIWVKGSSVACEMGPAGLGDDAIVMAVQLADAASAQEFFTTETQAELGDNPGTDWSVPPARSDSDNGSWEVATFEREGVRWVVWLDRDDFTVGALSSETDDVPTLVRFWKAH